MKIEILTEKEINVKFMKCEIEVFPEDATVNGECDDEDKCLMPFLVKQGKHSFLWKPVIDIDEGKIVDWPNGTTAETNYKSVDCNRICFYDENEELISWFDKREQEEVKEYEGYVPEILDCVGDGYGDYVQMKIDKNGYIENFNKEDINQIFNEEEE